MHVRALFDEVMKNCEPFCSRLGDSPYLAPLEGLVYGRAPFERQRAVHRRTSALAGVTDSLVQELKTDEPSRMD